MILKELVEASLDTIFNPLQEIGTPKRFSIKSNNDFLSQAVKYHTTQPVYANLHENKIIYNHSEKKEYIPLSTENLFFDFDIRSEWGLTEIQGLELVERDIKKVVGRLKTDYNFTDKDIIKVWTAKKGGHLHVRIKAVEGLENEDFAIEVRRKIIGFKRKVTEGCKTADQKVFGDLSRVARVPGISRPENKKIPLVVDHDVHLIKFLNQYRNYEELIEYGVNKLYNWGNGIRKLDDIVSYEDYKDVLVHKRGRIDASKLGSKGMERNFHSVAIDAKGDLLKFFKLYMPHNVAEKFCSNFPSYEYRFVGARCLFEAGMSIDVVANLIASIGWEDFNYDVTYEALENILNWNNV